MMKRFKSFVYESKEEKDYVEKELEKSADGLF